MSPELAQRLASEAMSTAVSTQGDALMTLGQARARMDIETVLPTAPIKLLDEVWGISCLVIKQMKIAQRFTVGKLPFRDSIHQLTYQMRSVASKLHCQDILLVIYFSRT